MEVEFEVIRGRVRAKVESLHAHTVEPRVLRGEILEYQRGLENRMMRRVVAGRDRLDDVLERDALMPVSLQAPLPDSGQQVAERWIAAQADSEREQVHDWADQGADLGR